MSELGGGEPRPDDPALLANDSLRRRVIHRRGPGQQLPQPPFPVQGGVGLRDSAHLRPVLRFVLINRNGKQRRIDLRNHDRLRKIVGKTRLERPHGNMIAKGRVAPQPLQLRHAGHCLPPDGSVVAELPERFGTLGSVLGMAELADRKRPRLGGRKAGVTSGVLVRMAPERPLRSAKDIAVERGGEIIAVVGIVRRIVQPVCQHRPDRLPAGLTCHAL